MGLYEEGFTQNRELSWLRYDERVLEEAMDVTVPLFERLNYIAIFNSNLEEFIQVRVGGLIYEESDNDGVDSRSGMTAGEQLDAIYKEIYRLLLKKDEIQAKLEKELAAAGVVRVKPGKLSNEDYVFQDQFFADKVKSKLKSKLVSKPKDFPFLNQDKTYIMARLDAENKDLYAVVDIPESLPKIYIFDNGNKSAFRYMLTEDIIKMHVNELFFPFETEEIYSIDIARNAEVLAENYAGDQLKSMKELSIKRKHAAPDKLIVDNELSEVTKEYLMQALDLENSQVFNTKMIDYSFVGELEDALPERLRDILCFEKLQGFNQLRMGYGSMIDRLKKKEFLCAYPYETMDPFLELLRECTTDERVKEIRITIYRLSSQPRIVDYLEQAAKNGKKVTAVMELRARFDEDNNIDYSERMRKHGIKVCFGDEKYKIHSKLAQIVLNEGGRTTYISHLSTGNFNEKTATKYTDLAMITYDQRIGQACNEMWKDLMDSKVGYYDHILTSPKTMKETCIKYIRREAEKGPDGRIFIKVNSITDEDLIEELMRASCEGCKINMIVRGICCILPGIKDCTENIQIVNVVGRYLEHSRIYLFGSGSDEVMYISSADFMNRNMSKRVELACPIYNTELRSKVKKILLLNYKDNVKGRILGSDGRYHRKMIEKELIDSQMMLMELFSK